MTILHVLVIALPITLLITRSPTGEALTIAVSTPLARRDMRAADIWDGFTTCGMCVGFWATLITGISLHATFIEASAAYTALLFAVAIYDRLLWES